MNQTKTRILQNGQPHERRHPLASGGVKITTFIPLKFKKRGIKKVIVTPAETPESSRQEAKQSVTAVNHDLPLLKALALASYWQKEIDEGIVNDAVEIAEREQMDRTRVNEILRLSMLAPDIAEMILLGRQPRTLSLEFLVRRSLPMDWQAQREMIEGLVG